MDLLHLKSSVKGPFRILGCACIWVKVDGGSIAKLRQSFRLRMCSGGIAKVS